MNSRPVDGDVRNAALAGRVALLLAAFACAVAASLAAGVTMVLLIVVAGVMACAAACRPLVARLGKALKPAVR